MARPNLKANAIALRKQGKSYKQISEELGGVAKSTLSHWLRSVGLTPTQRKRLKVQQYTSGKRQNAPEAVRKNHRAKRARMLEKARQWVASADVAHSSLALVGASLYWAEGAKCRRTFKFTNSDADMLRVYMHWLRKIIGAPEEDIRCHVYGYLDNGYTEEDVLDYWCEVVNVPTSQFYRTVFVKSKGRKKRKNVLPFGVLHVSVLRALKYQAVYSAIIELFGKDSGFVDGPL